MNVFVLCTGGSARSILLESLLKIYGTSRLRGYAAVLQFGARVYPQAVLLLFRQNHDTVVLRSKSRDEFAKPDAPVMDLVITVCGGAAQETCLTWPSAAIRADCRTGDPAATVQTDWESACQSAFDILSRLPRAFTKKPFKIMQPADLKPLSKG